MVKTRVSLCGGTDALCVWNALPVADGDLAFPGLDVATFPGIARDRF